ncbi:hypothetical protein D9M71_535250 [compost metagenome]
MSPRRAPARYLEGAPPYVTAVRDAGTTVNDRYTVQFGWPIWQPTMGRDVPYLGFSSELGVSMWGQCSPTAGGRLIRWDDLPLHLQAHVINRANYPDKVLVKRLVRLGNRDCSGRKFVEWAFANQDGIGFWGDTFGTKALARSVARKLNIILLED